MGYESKLYFVRKGNLGPSYLPEDEGHSFAIKLVELNMGKLGGMPACFKRPTDWFVYADNGNTPILRDKYGEPLYECTIGELWRWMHHQIDKDGYWYMFGLLDGVIRGFCNITEKENCILCTLKPEFKNIIVLHYGY